MRRRAKPRVVVLSRGRGLASIVRLVDALTPSAASIDVVDPLACTVTIGARSTVSLAGRAIEADVLVPRFGATATAHGLAVLRALEVRARVVLNDAASIDLARDKVRTLQALAEEGVPVPATALVRHVRDLDQVLAALGGPPAVVKVPQGMQGRGVALLESAASLESFLRASWDLPIDLLVQRYIAEAAGRDLRALVVGGRVVAAMRRWARGGEFRANLHRGGSAEPARLPRATARLAIRAAAALGLDVAGVDLLEADGGPVVIEVNSSPGLEGIEQASGKDVAAAIARLARSRWRGS